MKLDRYELTSGRNLTTFEFLSEGIRIDSSLDKYDSIVLFPARLAKANEQLKRSGFSKKAFSERK